MLFVMNGYSQTTETFSTPGTFNWTCPAGVTSVDVSCWGAGGGGSTRSLNGVGGGGGGGAYAGGTVSVTPGNTYTIVVGSGGGPAVNGGNSSFNSTIIVAEGGSGVALNTATGGAGGTIAASTGTIRRPGGNGADGLASNYGGGGGGGAGTTNNGTTATNATGGAGGATGGGNGGNGRSGSQGDGLNGNTYGGGGGGSYRTGNPGSRLGGTGANGCLSLTYTCPSISANAGLNQNLSACVTSTTLTGNSVPSGMNGLWTIVSGTATITNPFIPNTTVTDIQLNTTVTLRWTISNGTCGSLSDDMTITTVSAPGCINYCTPNFPSGVYSVQRVQFASIDNSSDAIYGGPSPTWENFTGISSEVIRGNTYPITVTASGAGTGNTFYVNAFFDWNNDGDFLDASEQVNLGTHNNASSIGIINGNITIPAGASTGIIRMRVINRLGAYSTSCNTTSYGQSEDYCLIILPAVSCTGSPVAGSALPAVNFISTSQGASLFWSESPQNGYTYQWQEQDGFGIWNDISGANSHTFYASGLSVGTYYYRLIVTCTNSGLSSTTSQAQVNVENFVVYCNPAALNCSLGDRITRVQFNTLDNNSGTTCVTGGYSDYSRTISPTNLEIGETYNFSLTVGPGTGSHSAGVWIDLNQNGSFADAGEFFSIGQLSISPNTTTTVPIAIPTTAIEGYTRMRVQYIYNYSLLSSWSCYSNATIGETEDYTVNVVCGTVPNDITGRSPANALPLPCGSAATLFWNPHRCADGFKVYMDKNNPPTTLVSTTTSTSYYTGNLDDNSTYYWKIVPYSGSGDGAGSVWSFTTMVAIEVVSSYNEEGCTDGGLCLDVSGGAFPDYHWYDVPVGGAPVATGTQYCPAGLTDTTTFYVSNIYQGSPTSITCGTTSGVVCGGSGGFGNMFDIQAKAATIEVMAVSVRFRNLGTAGNADRPYKVYYRTNSFIGNANSSSGWILHHSGTVNVPNTTTVPTYLDIPNFFVPAGQVYGVYVVYDNQYASGANIYANSDLEVKTGSSICSGEFSGEFTDRSFEGVVYYQITCSSPTSPVEAIPYVSNNFVSLVTSSVSGLVEQCTEYGWTYYSQASSPEVWLFAINKNGNTFTATVDITKGVGVYQNVNATESAGSFLMGRYWNITLTSGSINPALPVSVRMFFDPAEITAAVNQRNTVQAGYPDTYPTDWRWFKSEGVAFDPAVDIDGNTFNFSNVTLTTAGALTVSGAPYSGTINGVAYVDLDGITSFSGGTGGVGFSKWPTAPLPVELISFNAKESDRSNYVFWSTATEINNDYFAIESSADGIHFSEIGTIQGAGNSNSKADYYFSDFNFYMPVTYYRLRQVDFDGHSEYSHVVAVYRSSDVGFKVNLYPNPAKDIINIEYMSDHNSPANYKLYHSTGKIIQSGDLGSTISLTRIDVSGLCPGLYFLEVQSSGEVTLLKFVRE
jgi:hypothetical protein